MSKLKYKYEFNETQDIRYRTILDLLSLATGLDIAISSIQKGDISNKASDKLRELITNSYINIASKIALDVIETNTTYTPDKDDSISITTPEGTDTRILIELHK